MKLKLLWWKYSDNSGTKRVRIYTEEYFAQAERDFIMLQDLSVGDKTFFLEDIEVYNPNQASES